MPKTPRAHKHSRPSEPVTPEMVSLDAWNREFTVSDGPINKATGQPYWRTSQKFIDFMASQSKSVVSTKEFETIERMAENVWSHPEAKQLLASGIAEGTIRIEDYCGLPGQGLTA